MNSGDNNEWHPEHQMTGTSEHVHSLEENNRRAAESARRLPPWPPISEPSTVPEIEVLRRTLADWDEWPYMVPSTATGVIEAARAVLALYDQQQLAYKSALEAQLTEDALRRLNIPPSAVMPDQEDPREPYECTGDPDCPSCLGDDL